MRASICAAALAAACLVATGSFAQAPKPKPAATKTLPADTVTRLKSGDAGQIAAALEDVQAAGRAGASAVPTIVALLDKGLDLALTQSAIDGLGATESESASEVLASYARHRSPNVRRAAARALAQTRGASAVKALRLALTDPDANVRKEAAVALGALKAKDAVPDLLLALDRRIPEAAAAIGHVCAPTDCEKLASKMGSLPFDIVTSALDPILFRSGGEIPDDTKIKVIGRLREMATKQVHVFLKDVQSRWPKDGSGRVKQSLDQAVLATANAPGGAP